MTRLEKSAWTIVGGAATVFVLAALLANARPGIAFFVVALAVGVWSMRARALDALALAVIAWLLLTGLDVHHRGELSSMTREDLAFLAVLVLVALLSVAGGRMAQAVGAWPADRLAGIEPGMPPAPEDPSWNTPGASRDDGGLAAADGDRFCRPSRRSPAGPRNGPRGRVRD